MPGQTTTICFSPVDRPSTEDRHQDLVEGHREEGTGGNRDYPGDGDVSYRDEIESSHSPGEADSDHRTDQGVSGRDGKAQLGSENDGGCGGKFCSEPP